MPTTEFELASSDGAEARTVRLQLQADGGVRLHAYDKGATAKLTFDRDEYEFWVTVPPEAVARLAFELLRDKYQGRLQAVTEFRDFPPPPRLRRASVMSWGAVALAEAAASRARS